MVGEEKMKRESKPRWFTSPIYSEWEKKLTDRPLGREGAAKVKRKKVKGQISVRLS